MFRVMISIKTFFKSYNKTKIIYIILKKQKKFSKCGSAPREGRRRHSPAQRPRGSAPLARVDGKSLIFLNALGGYTKYGAKE